MTALRQLRPSARFCLTPRGDSTEAAYRKQIIAARAHGGRKAFEGARADWALAHGLEPDDGAFFGELRARPRTLRDLGEALAICGQSSESVAATMERLAVGGFVLRTNKTASRPEAPSMDSAMLEVQESQRAFESARLEFGITQFADRFVIQRSLREAVFRMVVARRFLASMSG
jgi:hypothetical protein